MLESSNKTSFINKTEIEKMQQKQIIEELIVKSFSGEITLEEKVILRAWINEKPENEIYFAHLKNIRQISYPVFSADEINLEKAEKRVEKQIHHVSRRPNPMFVWWQRIAAVVVLPLMLLAGYLLTYEPAPVLTETVYQEVVSPQGTYSKINLPDGSVVWLNSGSKLKYSVTPQKGKRDVFLSGEAYFEVCSDAKNPFLVMTEKVTVKATGTMFNVEAYPSDTIVAVTLKEGKVDVAINGKEDIAMVPNQRMIYYSLSNNRRIEAACPYKWYAWKDGVLMFRNDRLDYVFKRIGLTYNVDIAVKDPKIAAQLYRATFESESLDEILHLMKMTAPINYRKNGRVMSEDGLYSKERIEVYKE